MIARYLTPSRITTWERCRLAYKLKYVDHLEVGNLPAPQLVTGTYLHRALAAYHMRWPRDDASVLDLVAEVGASLQDELPATELGAARGPVAACVLEYHRWPERKHGADGHAEVSLRDSLGPLTLTSVVDWVTRDDGLVWCDEFKLSAPADDGLLQASFAHFGLRAALYRAEPITHRVVFFRRNGAFGIGARTILLDADTYRRTLMAVYETARAIGREFAKPPGDAWAPSPGERSCGVCDHAGVCPHAQALVAQAAF